MFWRRKSPPPESNTYLVKDLNVRGYMGYYDLADWWLTTFTLEEREYIEGRHRPMGSSGSVTLTEGVLQHIGTVDFRPSTAPHFLNGLATWFRTKKDASIGVRIAERAKSHVGIEPRDEHFALMNYVEIRYKQRHADPSAIADVIAACQRGIEIAPKVIAQLERDHAAAEVRSAELYKKLGESYEPERFATIGGSPFYRRLAAILRKQGRTNEAAEIEALHETEWLPYTLDHRRAHE